MKIDVHKTALKTILPFRELFLQENNFEIRYDACHERNRSDSYIISIGSEKIGYGSIKGKDNAENRDAVFEYYIIPPYRKWKSQAFSSLLTTTESIFIECQSNDLLLSSMLYEFAEQIYADVVLFEEDVRTTMQLPGVKFRAKRDDDFIFKHRTEPEGNYVLEKNDLIVATGGFMLYYNMPFADLYMEIHENYRQQGLGSFIIQELKKECYLQGRVPAARCNIQNKPSWSTMLKAGLKESGFMLTGSVKNTAY